MRDRIALEFLQGDMLSDRMRFALTIAGSLTLAYGITLALNWEKPHWAGMAVATIGLSTFGESIFKAFQRIGGTAVAIVMAFFFIANFAQERWQFAAAICAWLAFCVWRVLVDEKHYYFWNCCAFITPLLCFMSNFDSTQSFYIVEIRARETVLGVLCYTAVSFLLTRRVSHAKVNETTLEQLSRLKERIEDVRLFALEDNRPKDASARSHQIARSLMTMPQLITTAALESSRIRERGKAWQQLSARLGSISVALNRLESSVGLGTQHTQSKRARDTFFRALDELSARLGAVADLLNGKTEGARTGSAAPKPLDSHLQQTAAKNANPFEQGAALLRSEILVELDAETRDLYEAAVDIADVRRMRVRPIRNPWQTLIPDPEHLAAINFMVVAFWMSFLLYIYVPALPDGSTILVLSIVVGTILARMPWVSVPNLVLTVGAACLAGGLFHALLMPHLTDFTELGTALFVFTFAIAWIFHNDQQQARRIMGLSIFNLSIQVANQSQQYSITYVMNLFIGYAMVLLLLLLAQNLPISWRPEHVLRRLMRRYMNSLLSILEGMRWDRPSTNTWFARQLRAYHMNQLLTLPPRIDQWVGFLHGNFASETDKAAFAGLVDRLELLSHRVSELARLRATEADPVWYDQLTDEVRAWREAIATAVHRLLQEEQISFGGGDPWRNEDGSPVTLEVTKQRLEARLAAIENIISHSSQAEHASVEGTAHMQRVLSAYRGTSMALISVVERARQIAWSRLAETRF